MACILITGATSGLGKALALQLGRDGHELILVSRRLERLEAVRAEISAGNAVQAADIYAVDIGEPDAIRKFLERFAGSGRTVDVLISNAAVFTYNRRVNSRGEELMLATNHLGGFMLTLGLLPHISRPGRIIQITTKAISHARIDVDDLNCEKRFMSFKAYSRSKLAAALCTQELARRLQAQQVPITANCALIGGMKTDMGARYAGFFNRMAWNIVKLFFPSPEQVAEDVAWMVSAPETAEETGAFFAGRLLAHPTLKHNRLDELAGRLWKWSEVQLGPLLP